MNRPTWKAFVLVAGLLTACAAQPAAARAGLIADTWYAIFGPPGTPYFPGAYTSYYGPSYSATVYYRTGYRSACCRPAPVCCQPCNPCPTACNPCPTTCNPCATGSCETAPAASAGGQLPQTFKKPAGTNEEPPQPDSKFKSRDDSKKFRPTDKSKLNGEGKKTEFPTPAGDGDGNEGTGKTAVQRKALRVPTGDPSKDAPGPVIRQKKPVPAKPPRQDSDKEKQKELPVLVRPNFDEKIAWKPVLPRTRLIIHARIVHPQLSRTIVDPNAGWRPIRSGTRVVRK
jgi:hypothetical protein